MYDDLCRLCSQPHYDNGTSEIFNSNGNLAAMIQECTNLIIDKNDKLPDKICKLCNDKLNLSYAFRRQCVYVDCKFRQGIIFYDYDKSIKKAECKSDNNLIENTTQLSTPAKTQLEEDLCAEQNTDTPSCRDHNATDTKTIFRIKTCNKVKTKKNSAKSSTKSKLKENNDKKEQNDVDIQKSEIHMCYLCGALVKRIHSHMKAHRDAEKPKLKKYRCEKCGAAFSRLNNLNIHLKTHLDVKPLKCTLCDKRFIIKRYLDRHMVVHTGDRPWKCQFCSKAFQTKYNLNTHVRVHTREKPFKCPFCELCFRQRAALNIHVRTHNSVSSTCT